MQNEELEVKLSECKKFGQWDLTGLNIMMADIPRKLLTNPLNNTVAVDGVLAKFIIPFSSSVVYVKAGVRSGHGYYDTKQPLMESIASEIGQRLGFDVASTYLWIIDASLFEVEDEEQEYSDEDDEGSPLYAPKPFFGHHQSFARTLHESGKVLVGVSPSYVIPNYSFFNCHEEFGFVTDEQELYELICEKGENVRIKVQQMFLFDFLINNPDRHNQNFGFLTSNKGDYEVFSPLIDHGQGLFCYESIEGVSDDRLLNKAAGHQTAFKDLMEAVQTFVGKEAVRYIDFQIEKDYLCSVVDRYSHLINSTRRVSLMKRLLEERWLWCQKRFGS